jgi:hypothetical protein
MKVGDLVKFDYINGHTGHLNRRVALYLGEDFIHRDDGVVVENHRVLMMGDHVPLNLDKGLLKYMRVINESR